MSVVGIILDHVAPIAGGRRSSLLAMPLGTGIVFDWFERLARRLGCETLHVLPAEGTGWPAGEDGRNRSASLDASVSRWSDVIGRLELTDSVLLMDSRYCLPDAGSRELGFADSGAPSMAAHLVVGGANEDGTIEYVDCDAQGRIRRIRRLHGVGRRPESHVGAVVMSLVPAPELEDSEAPASLWDLRVWLATHGAMSRDVPTGAECLDLSSEPGLLAMCEREVIRAGSGEMPPGYSRLAPGVLSGRGALIHESVRIVPPVIVQPGALIEEGAWIIGPSLIGMRSMVQRDAVIAQSVVTDGATIEAGATIRHELVDGKAADEDYAAVMQTEPKSRNGRGHAPGVRGAPPMALMDSGRKGLFYPACKRALDVVVSAIMLLLLLPLMIVVAILIRLDSPGPVFFLHRRERRDGRVFSCIKFRTMHLDAHRLQRALRSYNVVDGPQFKMRNDPRVTRVGRLIRSTNIDELPQLINVLLGHMSLVGPRPSPFKENQICVPWRRARLSVRPGITGLWQICRRQEREKGDFQEWIYYDTAYVRHMSLWLDVKILLATALTMGGRWQVPFHALVGDAGHNGKPDSVRRPLNGRRDDRHEGRIARVTAERSLHNPGRRLGSGAIAAGSPKPRRQGPPGQEDSAHQSCRS